MEKEGAMRVRVQEDERAIYRAIFPGDAVTSSENADLRTLRAHDEHTYRIDRYIRRRSHRDRDRQDESIVSAAMRARFILCTTIPIFPSSDRKGKDDRGS